VSILLLMALAAAGDFERAAAEVFALGIAPEAGVMLVHEGREQFIGHGGMKATDRVQVGSISKVLAGQVLAGMVAQGKIQLTDRVERYAPAGVKMPHGMTVLELATHTSGLPRNGGGKTVWDAASGAKLVFQPGEGAQYSNVGFWLLGDVLAKAGGKSYVKLLEEYVTGPLGMKGTGAEPEETASTASVYSTAQDMARWMRHLMGTRERTGLAVYVHRRQLREVNGLDGAGRADGVGLGWIYQAEGPLLEKTGAVDGFMAYMAFVPGGRTGVFVTVKGLDIEKMEKLAGIANRLVRRLEKGE
jgi:serine-type D-Ala-D-Ala carboxypeptidase/endopeptidase